MRNIIAGILQALLAVAFIYSGFHKLSHLDGTTKMFSSLGLPGWFAAFIGRAELRGGIGLLLIVIGAVVMHATKIPGGIKNGVAAMVLLALLAVVRVLRRPARMLA